MCFPQSFYDTINISDSMTNTLQGIKQPHFNCSKCYANGNVFGNRIVTWKWKNLKVSFVPPQFMIYFQALQIKFNGTNTQIAQSRDILQKNIMLYLFHMRASTPLKFAASKTSHWIKYIVEHSILINNNLIVFLIWF